jgi:sugar O-acyltransferase (sialic acid O-acetyltransferase NeuD family)
MTAMNPKKIILIGAGGHAKVVAEVAVSLGFTLIGYVDNNFADWLDIPQINESKLTDIWNEGIGYFLGLGGQSTQNLKSRYSLFLKYSSKSISPSLIHKQAIVSSTAKIGAGTLIGAGAVIQPMANIGKGVIINSGAIIEHDACIEDGSHIAPGAIVLGGVSIGRNCMIGAGSILLPGTTIPDETLVKANTLRRRAYES